MRLEPQAPAIPPPPQLSAVVQTRLEQEPLLLPANLPAVPAPASPRQPEPGFRKDVLGEPRVARPSGGKRAVQTERFASSRAVRAPGAAPGGSEARLGAFALARDSLQGGGDQQGAGRFAATGPGFSSMHGSGPSSSLVQGAVQTVGFHSAGLAGAEAVSARAAREAGFGKAAVAIASERESTGPPETLSSGVKVLFKPKPEYTAEARELRVEGEVLLEVAFLASGEVEVLRVIRGLGHGLDKAAVEAARRIQFEPARARGRAVDSSARVRILFQLAF